MSEEWPYPEEVVRKLLECKQMYQTVRAHRSAETIAFERYRQLLQESLDGGVGVRALARIMGLDPSTIREVARGRKPQNGDDKHVAHHR